MMVGPTPTKIPASPLASRNSLEIHNLDSSATLYIGNSNVTADRVLGNTSGKEIGPDSFWSLDITDEIELYGIVASDSIMVKITEVA